MNNTELDEAIEQANRIFSRQHSPAPEWMGQPVQREGLRRSSTSRPKDICPPASLDAERSFGQPHTKLFPFIGRKVRTPAGAGTLLQVFAGRVTVVLDSEMSRCSIFRPAQIEPVSWDLP